MLECDFNVSNKTIIKYLACFKFSKSPQIKQDVKLQG